MKLLSIPNIPNYQVDVENGVVYTMKYGRLREVKMRTKFKFTKIPTSKMRCS